MTSPEERFEILRNDASTCLRKIASEKFGNRLAEEIIVLVKSLEYKNKEKLKYRKFPYTEIAELQDNEGKFWIGYNGSNIVKKIGLPMIIPDVYYMVREKLQKDCKSVEARGPEASNLFRPTINYDERFTSTDFSILKLFAQSSQQLRKLDREVIEKEEFRPDFWKLDKYFGIGNIDLNYQKLQFFIKN